MKLLLVEDERRMAHYGISHCKPKPNSRKGKIGVSCHDGKIEFYAIIPQGKRAEIPPFTRIKALQPSALKH